MEHSKEDTVEANWKKWVRTLSNSTNPHDADLLIAKIEVLLTSERTRCREEVNKYIKRMEADYYENSPTSEYRTNDLIWVFDKYGSAGTAGYSCALNDFADWIKNNI